VALRREAHLQGDGRDAAEARVERSRPHRARGNGGDARAAMTRGKERARHPTPPTHASMRPPYGLECGEAHDADPAWLAPARCRQSLAPTERSRCVGTSCQRAAA
jgi:hypothetical protein